MEVLQFCINVEAIPDDDSPRAILHYFLSFTSIKVDSNVFPVPSGKYLRTGT